MALYFTDFQKLWNDKRFFAQLPPKSHLGRKPSDGTLVGDVLAVATELVGHAYSLGTLSDPVQLSKDLEVYEILPVLSQQSSFFWDRAARPLASQLATAKYPIRSQASHLIFWWARIGGLMGVPVLEDRVGCQELSATTDGSNIEFSWSIPFNSDPLQESNRRVRFSIDPYHPEGGYRMAGGGILNYLLTEEGSMGLIKPEAGSKDWKNKIEKWLFPDIDDTEICVDGSTYGVAFDMAPTGVINLKLYYVPPLPPAPGVEPTTRVTLYRMEQNLEPMRCLFKELHPSLEAPFQALFDYVSLDASGKDAAMKLGIVAFDITKPEKNRLKVYLSADRMKLKDIISDMTLGGRVAGPRIDDAMKNLERFFMHLFPYANEEDPELKIINPYGPNPDGILGRKGMHMVYYYEFFIGEPVPYSKIYFFMDALSKNDYETAKSTEMFLKEAGKPGEEGWMVDALAHAYSHRPLEKRNGLHTAVGFAMKPRGWEVINYYTPEFYAPDRV
ncbi:hypothetical protein H0H93_013533 [Arthromyces matolae]|nr:hypothetical protein H0H93_013533 [Arthromyces matolae]